MQNHIVLLIGGSSGTGKSYLARQLAEYYKIPLTEVDDIRIALQQMVNKESNSDLFTFIDNPNFIHEHDEVVCIKKLLDVGKSMWKSLDELISKHVVCNEPVIFEGDGIIPELLATRDLYKVKSVFIYDDIDGIKEKQVLRNRHGKESDENSKNILFSHTYGQEIKKQAEKYGFLVIQASPMETLFERTLEALKK